ncbi:MAG: hypothetical protein ACOYBY_10395 [Dermatophilaceae bacterium]
MSRHNFGSTTRTSLPALVTVLLMQALSAGSRTRRDRGDVPGWVLITVMTAGLVSTLWVFAGNALLDLFKSAISHVSGR